MTRKTKLLICCIILAVVLIIFMRPRHIRIDVSTIDDFNVMREGYSIAMTDEEKSEIIDMVEDTTIIPCLFPPSSGWTYKVMYTGNNNRTHSVVLLGGKITYDNRSYLPIGSNSEKIINRLDEIYRSKLVTVQITNASQITIINETNGREVTLEGRQLSELTDALSYIPSRPITSDNNDNTVCRLQVKYENGSIEELPIMQSGTILYKGQYMLLNSYAAELIESTVGKY